MPEPRAPDDLHGSMMHAIARVSRVVGVTTSVTVVVAAAIALAALAIALILSL